MASASPPNMTAQGDSTEANGSKGTQQESTVTDEQWKAMKNVIDNLYAYRQSE